MSKTLREKRFVIRIPGLLLAEFERATADDRRSVTAVARCVLADCMSARIIEREVSEAV